MNKGDFTPLINAVANETKKNTVRFHMPGHKGKNIFELSVASDVTEYDATDNLYAPCGAILAAEEECARAFGAKRTLFSTGGATLALQASVMYADYLARASKRPIFADRMCHKSVFNAFLLCESEPTWFYPEDEEAALRIEREKPTAVIVTAVDYYGKFRLSKNLIKACKNAGSLLICDNSHGTHLAFYEAAMRYPLKMGADISVDSAHKTLPCLGGGAYLNVSRETNVDCDRLLKFMSVFGSTSPSYLILQSLDFARNYMSNHGEEMLNKLARIIMETRNTAEQLGYSLNSLKEHDIFRLVIGAKSYGEALYAFLYENAIVCEMHDFDRVVLICTVADEKYMYDKLADALRRFAEMHELKPCDNGIIKNKRLPERAFDSKTALYTQSIQALPLEQALNRVSAEIYAPYPPGIPEILPGEIFNEESIKNLSGHFETVKVIPNIK